MYTTTDGIVKLHCSNSGCPRVFVSSWQHDSVVNVRMVAEAVFWICLPYYGVDYCPDHNTIASRTS